MTNSPIAPRASRGIGLGCFMTLATCASLAGCGDGTGPNQTTGLCMDEFSVDKGFSRDGDAGTCEPAPECSTAASVEAECASEGHPCQVRVTREAARCIAESQGLPDGIAPWTVWLVYNHGFETATWNVAATLETTPSSRSGVSFALDATTGELVERSNWDEVQ